MPTKNILLPISEPISEIIINCIFGRMSAFFPTNFSIKNIYCICDRSFNFKEECQDLHTTHMIFKGLLAKRKIRHAFMYIHSALLDSLPALG